MFCITFGRTLVPGLSSLRSKRSRANETAMCRASKDSDSGRAKIGARTKKEKEQGGGGAESRIFARTRHMALRSYGNASYAGYGLSNNLLPSQPSFFSFKVYCYLFNALLPYLTICTMQKWPKISQLTGHGI